MKMPQPFPYQGSKRNLAPAILRHLPKGVGTLIEPFAGSAAITIAVAANNLAEKFVINDSNQPLIALWWEIINRPEKLARCYESLWREQHTDRTNEPVGGSLTARALNLVLFLSQIEQN